MKKKAKEPMPGASLLFAGPTPKARARNLKLMAFDVDGTLTGGGISIGQNIALGPSQAEASYSAGEVFKVFSVKDGLGLARLRQHGLLLAIVTARKSPIVLERARELGITAVVQGAKDKAKAMQALAKQHSVLLHQCGFMGDDLPDLAAFSKVGWRATPRDAHIELRLQADWVSQFDAAQGAVRECCEYLIRQQCQ